MLRLQCVHFDLHGDNPSLWVGRHCVSIGMWDVMGGLSLCETRDIIVLSI